MDIARQQRMPEPTQLCTRSPRSVRLRIFQHGPRFRVEIGYSKSIPIDLSREDVSMLNRALRKRIEVPVKMFRHKVTLTEQESEEVLKVLALEGSNALKRIFDKNTIELLKTVLSSTAKPALHIVSEDFFLPWELLYDDFKSGQYNYKNFWGHKYVISRTMPKAPRAFPVHPEIYVIAQAIVGLLVNEALDQVINEEVPALEQFQNDGRVILIRLRRLDQKKREEEINLELRHFLARNLHVAHFACHAKPNKAGEPADESFLLLSNSFPVSLREFRVYELTLDGDPLAILNACDTGVRDPLQTSSFVSTLLDCGARGVIATECEVPDVFAAVFAKHFYTRFLKGQKLGDAMLYMRRYLLRRYRNPLGLLYSLYADPDTKLIYLK